MSSENSDSRPDSKNHIPEDRWPILRLMAVNGCVKMRGISSARQVVD